MNIYFILVKPDLPENIGASARALKTMGFKCLRLVNPCDHLQDRAQWLAHGSLDILKRAKVYTSLQSAVKGMDLIIGTTSKKRTIRKDYHSPDQLLNILKRKKRSITKLAVLFGREETGLLNDEIKQCDIVSTVPMATRFPSLNLSQAVMIYAYRLSDLLNDDAKRKKERRNNKQHIKLRDKISDLLNCIDIDASSSVHRRVLERIALLNDIDMHLAYSIYGKISRKIRGS